MSFCMTKDIIPWSASVVVLDEMRRLNKVRPDRKHALQHAYVTFKAS
jgi:hypothetical protein